LLCVACVQAADVRKGGFFSGLNQRRRDVGSAEHGRQVSLLLHANKRLEELTNRCVTLLADLYVN
jgi:hypothetical protein